MYAAGDHSLMFVRADGAEIVADVREDKTRYRMLLGYHGVTYDHYCLYGVRMCSFFQPSITLSLSTPSSHSWSMASTLIPLQI